MNIKDLPNVGVVFLIAGMLFIIGIVILSSFQTNASIGGNCVDTLYTDGGTDYFLVNTASVNTTAMSDIQLFKAYTAFTPRLNFTVQVKDNITAGLNFTSTVLHWLMNGTTYNVVNQSMVLSNDTTIIGRGNYTVNTTDNVTYSIYWLVSTYSTQYINVTVNRTFVKNVDDLVVSPSKIYTGALESSFLTENTPSTLGADKTFKFKSTSPGVYLNNSNWAVTWSYYNRTCISTNGNSAANASIAHTITALSEIPTNWMLLIAVVIAASVVIGILITNLSNKSERI